MDNAKDLAQDAKLDALSAFATFVEQDVDAAVSQLAGQFDPIRIHAAASLLVQADRFREALDLMAGKRIDAQWAYLRVYASVALNELVFALDTIHLAQKECDKWAVDRCRIAFAEAAFSELLKDTDDTGLSVIATLTSEQKDLLTSTIDVLTPILHEVRLQQQVTSRLQRSAIEFSIHAYGMLGQLSQIVDLVDPLLALKPVPLVLTELTLRRVCTPPDGFITRLRSEHPQNFGALFAAALLENELRNDSVAAFDSLQRIEELAATESDRAAKGYCNAVFEVSLNLDDTRFRAAKAIVERLLGHNNPLALYFDAFELLRSNQPTEAIALLMQHERNQEGVWWQALAEAQDKSGESTDAERSWLKACELVPHPRMVNYFAGLAIQKKRFADAAGVLEKAVAVTPEDIGLLNRLAFAYVNVRRYSDAVPLFEKLILLEPQETTHRLNLAVSLARSGRLQDALTRLNELAPDSSPNLHHIGTYTSLLNALGREAEAFDALEHVREQFWDDPDFLLLYMATAHRAKQEASASLALKRIHALQSAGQLERPILTPLTIDELTQQITEQRNQRRSLLLQVSKGQLPWLFADSICNTPPMRAWHVHTQDLKWLAEDRENSAEFTIYATNAFAVFQQNGTNQIDHLEAVEPGSEIVADISALITLFKLNCLPTVFQYCAHVYMPASYGDLPLRDTDNLSAHQPALEDELRRIREAIYRGKVSVIDTADHAFPPQVLDEAIESAAATTYRLSDLHILLANNQTLSLPELDELRGCAHYPVTAGRSIDATLPIAIDLSTLSILARFSWFDQVLNYLQVVISDADNKRLAAELLGYEETRSVLQEHNRFWRQMNDFAGHWSYKSSDTLMRLQQKHDSLADTSVHFDASILAIDLNLPLLADDRVCQNLTVERHRSNTRAAFSSDQLLYSFAKHGHSTWAWVSNAQHQLMRWRYRFLVPDIEILKVFADEARSNLPGARLRDTAAYVQASMRDPGLFCGLEPTDPPTPMALKLFLAVNQSCAKFIEFIWSDSSFNSDQREVLTHWCIRHLLPATPRGLAYSPLGRRVGQLSASTFLQIVMNCLVLSSTTEDANRALRAIAHDLGIDDEHLLEIASEAARARSFVD